MIRVGPLRFQLPTGPVASFAGVKAATEYSLSCTQMSAYSSQAGGLDQNVLDALATNPMFNDNVVRPSRPHLLVHEADSAHSSRLGSRRIVSRSTL